MAGSAFVAVGLSAATLSHAAGERPKPRPQLVKMGNFFPHICPIALPRADYRPVSVDDPSLQVIRVWCFNIRSSENEHSWGPAIGEAYYRCVDNQWQPVSYLPKLQKNPQNGLYYVTCP